MARLAACEIALFVLADLTLLWSTLGSA
jgi:hypothetical protein